MAKTRRESEVRTIGLMVFYLCLAPWPWSTDPVLALCIRAAFIGLAGREAWLGSQILPSWQRAQLRASLGTASGIGVGYFIWSVTNAPTPWGLEFLAQLGLEPWYILLGLLGAAGYGLGKDTQERKSLGFGQRDWAYTIFMVSLCVLRASGEIKNMWSLGLIVAGLVGLGILNVQANLEKPATEINSEGVSV